MTVADRQKLGDHFREHLSGEVGVHVTTHAGECSLCVRARGLLTEIASLSDRLSLRVDEGGDPRPAIRLEGAARGVVRFVGVPSGYEFPAFIESLVDVSRGASSLSQDTLMQLDTLDRPVHLQVFTTPT